MPKKTTPPVDRDNPTQYRASCTRFLHGHGPATAADILARIPTDLGLDTYGAGGAVEALEKKICELLGKPAAVFMPSGTMAQQIALRIHADRRNIRAVAWHPTCHLEIHEDKAYQRLHDLVGINVGHPRKIFTLDELKAIPERIAAVLFELPQREIGGVLPSWDDLRKQVDYVKSTGAAAHMDGARLWESAPFYGKPVARIAALFDTVYVSFYKGIGALPGCCLAGEEDVIKEARAWRKRHGGTLYGMWPNAASAIAGLDKHLPLMPRYVEHTRKIAEKLKAVPNLEINPNPPHTNMMHLYLRADEAAVRAALARIAREQKIYLWGGTQAGQGSTRLVEFTVGEATLGFKPQEVADLIGSLVS